MNNNGMRYHYTSVEALTNILTTKKIRLTHCEDLEDSTEGKYLLEKLKIDLNEYDRIHSTMTRNFFVVCFCSYVDCSYLWDNYGKVNIGFDFEAMKNDIKFISDKTSKKHDTSGTQFGTCSYTNCEDAPYIETLKYVKDKLNDIDFNNIQSQQYAYLSCNRCFFLKPKKYEPEHESRIVSHLWERTPYQLDNGRKYIEFHFTPNKVKSITIGPSKELGINKKRVEEFIKKSAEYKHVRIESSNT